MKVNKKRIIMIIIVLLAIVLYVIKGTVMIHLNEYDASAVNENQSIQLSVDTSVNSYKFTNDIDIENYKKFVLENLYPEKLRNFVDYDKINIKSYSDKATGETLLRDYKFYAYRGVLAELFEMNIENFDKYPLSNNFLSKHKNLRKEFKLHNEEVYITDYVYDKCSFNVEDRWNIDKFGDAEFAILHHFHYTLDEEGNIDDIIFDYTGWDEKVE